MSLRLYQITDTQTKKATGVYYPSKPAAKAERDALNKEHNANLRFIVSPGPDHHNYHG